MIVGIDLGTRSMHLSLLDGDRIYVRTVTTAKLSTRYAELRYIAERLRHFPLLDCDAVFVEEPVVAGARNLRVSLQIAQVAGVILALSPAPTYLVPVSKWKKETVGSGNATKEQVSDFLSTTHSGYSQACAGNQDLIDATCIALYGRVLLTV